RVALMFPDRDFPGERCPPPSGPGFSLPRAQRGNVSEWRAEGWRIGMPKALFCLGARSTPRPPTPLPSGFTRAAGAGRSAPEQGGAQPGPAAQVGRGSRRSAALGRRPWRGRQAGETFAMLAQRGAGKRYTGAVMAEEFHKNHRPFGGFDPIDVWWGL